ncbi:MAG TPA: acyl-CoA thioesterase/bile acid-CoA:amino acid N-acyltransferase family protein [Gammaproteobacteria bacterium]|nr:acyl-CoA thioesterase/bile acid-CoA:amino acid N-acyltransferase family protein [Gammaproteobacteria bacterium]
MFQREPNTGTNASIIFTLVTTAAGILALVPTSHLALAASHRHPTANAGCLKPPPAFSSPAVLADTAPAKLWDGWTYGHRVTLAASPASTLKDQPADIRVKGLEPGEPITLRARMQGANHAWAAHATFVAGADGTVDTTHEAPRYGSYSGVHAMGLVWSMLPVGVSDPRSTLWIPAHSNYRIDLEAVAKNRILAKQTLVRQAYLPNTVTPSTVDAEGLVGELYTPATPGPHPAVLLLGGSEGGLQPQVAEAALLASHGYVALGLAYFQGMNPNPRLRNLPKQLVDIPLEYFYKAATWLRRQPGVDAKHIAVIGWSKGAEAALAAAAYQPHDFQAVIGFMPSSVVWAGLQYGPAPPRSSWTLDGKPLPYANPVVDPSTFGRGKPLAFVSAYATGLKDKAAAAKAAIPVERILGPVLLISATDDQVWPSSVMARQVMQRLKAHHHAYADTSLCYAGAGHVILPPYRPVNADAFALPGGGSFVFGGRPIPYAYADRNAWSRILAFLHRALY